MANPEQEVLGRIDGRDPNIPNYPPQNWTGVSLYRERPLGSHNVTRPAGADPGKRPGEQWWTPSALDKVTVLAEVLTGKFKGQDAFAMLSGLFAVHVLEMSPAKVREELGL